jgi:hypothetical protein
MTGNRPKTGNSFEKPETRARAGATRSHNLKMAAVGRSWVNGGDGGGCGASLVATLRVRRRSGSRLVVPVHPSVCLSVCQPACLSLPVWVCLPLSLRASIHRPVLLSPQSLSAPPPLHHHHYHPLSVGLCHSLPLPPSRPPPPFALAISVSLSLCEHSEQCGPQGMRGRESG